MKRKQTRVNTTSDWHNETRHAYHTHALNHTRSECKNIASVHEMARSSARFWTVVSVESCRIDYCLLMPRLWGALRLDARDVVGGWQSSDVTTCRAIEQKNSGQSQCTRWRHEQVRVNFGRVSWRDFREMSKTTAAAAHECDLSRPDAISRDFAWILERHAARTEQKSQRRREKRDILPRRFTFVSRGMQQHHQQQRQLQQQRDSRAANKERLHTAIISPLNFLSLVTTSKKCCMPTFAPAFSIKTSLRDVINSFLTFKISHSSQISN